MTRYTDFVKENIKAAPGANQKEKMRAVAALWRQQNGATITTKVVKKREKKAKPAVTGGKVEVAVATAPTPGISEKVVVEKVKKPRKKRTPKPKVSGGSLLSAIGLGATPTTGGAAGIYLFIYLSIYLSNIL